MPATVNFEGEFPYVREVTGSVAFSAPWTTPFDVLIANNSEENVIVFDFDVQVPGDYTAILFADFGKWTGYETWNTDGISELHYPWETKFFDGPETRNRRWDTFTEFVVELDY